MTKTGNVKHFLNTAFEGTNDIMRRKGSLDLWVFLVPDFIRDQHYANYVNHASVRVERLVYQFKVSFCTQELTRPRYTV